MIPSLAKQFTADERRFLGALREQRRVEQPPATIPSLGKRLVLEPWSASGKTPDARRAWPLLVPPPPVPPPLPGMLEVAAAAYFIPNLDRKLDPFPRGKAWYGNYTGPGNERRDWEEDHLEPQTPLDRAPMQHDQEYSNLEEKYGYGHYETDPDGKRRFHSDDGSFMTMRLDTEHEGIHLGLIGADTRLMWRSTWYPLVGLTEGKYDLTFSKGPRGAESLVTDVLVAGIILQVFPILISIDVAFLGITVGRHVALEANQVAMDILRNKPFPNATMRSMWTEIPAIRIGGMTFGSYHIGGSGYLFGNKRVPYEIGMRNTTMADIITTIVCAYLGVPPVVSFAIGYVVHQWSVGHYDDRAKLFEHMAHRAPDYYGRRIGDGAEYYGGLASGGAKYYGGQISGGAKYYGGQISQGTKSAGRKASDWAKQAGGGLAGGAKQAGGKLSDAWKGLGSGLGGLGSELGGGLGRLGGGLGGALGGALGGGGGGGGGCFLTTACARSLATEEAVGVLDALRAFRDRVLLGSTAGRALVQEYYVVAPEIVRRIDASADPRSEYRQIYFGLVCPAFEHVRTGQFAAAVEVYRRGVGELVLRWCPNLMISLEATSVVPQFVGELSRTARARRILARISSGKACQR